ncbi:MAG TPA: 50S ribosomal protein L21 [Chloroflexota bacterium]|nr:50S ribosomal protein L21 [Chloroflexota bacterium]
MYAIVRTGGRQYKVAPGQVIDVERLPAEEGQEVALDEVLLVGGEGNTLIGRPTVPGARVRATVAENFRSPKVIVFKYKSKVRYRRFNTHRQNLTRLKIEEILTGAPRAATTETAAVEEPVVETITETLVEEPVGGAPAVETVSETVTETPATEE